MIDNKSKKRLLAVTVVLVAVIGYMIYSSSTANMSYFKTIKEVQADKEFIGKNIRVGGKVVKGSVEKNGTQNRFKIGDSGKELIVTYTGQLPQTFGDDVQAICEGKLIANDRMVAKSIVTKCPTKYKSKEIGK